ncbi:MAG TPA: alkaline phosphatase family protein [Acidimicrobiia bacterium]|nr:alkaline phosphatase family protein [Acidimicrobiia bacterium]
MAGLLLVAALPVVDGPGARAAAAAAPCTGANPAGVSHVVWIFMENKRYGDVIGSKSAPYETGLAHQCGTGTAYRIVGHPSEPNYIGATTGGVQGIHDDAEPAFHRLTADNLFRQVRSTGRQARSYVESMPGNCAQKNSGQYKAAHNPAAFFVGGNDRAACQRDDVGYGAFLSDVGHDRLPAFSLVIPNLCHDTHSCPVPAGDRWLSANVGKLLASPAYRRGDVAVFIVWDEPTPMPVIVVSPSVRPGARTGQAVGHYSLLRTTEELLGIPHHLGKAASAPSLRGAFHL